MRRFILGILLFVNFAAKAQPLLTFDEALATMLAKNRSLAGARYAVEAAAEELRATRGLRFPRIDLVGGYTLLQRDVAIDLGGAKGVVNSSIETLLTDGVKSGVISPNVASFISSGLSPITSLDWRYTLQNRSFGAVGATFTQPIYMGGRINIANRAARLRYESTRFQLDAAESALMTELVERYYGVVVASEVVGVRREVVRAVEQHLHDALAMEQEGLLAHSAILYLEYRHSEAQRDLADAEHELQVAKRALATTLSADSIVLPYDKIFICKDIYSLDYYLDESLKLNPILAELNNDILLAEEGVKLSRAGLLPEVVAMGAGSIYAYELSGMVPRWAVGIGVKIPIFDGLSKERKYTASKAGLKRAIELVENGRSNIALLVEKEYYAVCNAIVSIESSRRSIEFAESYMESTYEGFRAGVVSSADLIDAQAEYAVARVEYLNSAYEFCKSLARLLEASGLSSTFLDYRTKGEIINL